VSAIQALSDADLAKVRRGGWPVHRVLEHVIESEWLYATLIAHLQGKPVPERGKTSCEGQPVDDVLRMLEASRLAVVGTLAGVEEDVFYDVQRMGHAEYSVYSVLEHVANHDREHAGQITAIVAAS